MLLLECTKVFCVGLVTLFVSLLPMLPTPGAILTMLRVLFPIKIRGFIHPAPTFWNAINQFMTKVDLEENRGPFIPLPFLIQVAAGVLLFAMIMRRPTKRFFLMSFTTFSLTSYLFGYSVHEKHLQYTMLTFLLLPRMFAEYYTFVMLVSVMALYPIACVIYNSAYILVFGAAIVLVTYFFEQSELRTEEAETYNPILPEASRSCYAGAVFCLNALKNKSQNLLFALAAIMLALLGVHGNAILFFGYHCLCEGMFEDFMYKCECVALLAVCAWVWLSTYLESIQVRRKKGKQ